MQLESLRVIHLSKMGDSSNLGRLLGQGLQGVFQIETCQRWLWICNEEVCSRLSEQFFQSDRIELFQGTNAYQFLLTVATGLESQIMGETDVFGQIKEAWKKSDESVEPGLRKSLSPWIQRLYEDTKEIRSQYLQHLGASSYGSMVRAFFKKQAKPSGPVLLVGAGKLAQSVAPYLLENELWVSNRSPEALEQLYESLNSKSVAQIRKIIGLEAELRAWQEASCVVMCIPEDSAHDIKRIEAWTRRDPSKKGWILHLGMMREHAGGWKSLESVFFALDELFGLNEAQGRGRSVQITQARKACREKAMLRALGGSVSIPHGWEDLAVFA